MNPKKIHWLIWTIFIFYESILIGVYTGHFSSITSYIVHYALNISLFYLHAYLLGLALLEKKNHRLWMIPVFLLIELVVYISLLFGIEYGLASFTNLLNITKVEINTPYLISAVYRALYFIGFSTGYYFLITSVQERVRNTEAENALLKAQINPHFLFNTLDFIYYNAKDHSPVAAETIVALAEMMRYSSDSSQTREYIQLGNEIRQVESLINLHQLRENHELEIRFDYDELAMEVKIIPMVLITLIENMFKHGNLKSERDVAKIFVLYQEKTLTIETFNLKSTTPADRGFNSGTVNILKRLEYAYGKGAVLSTKQSENAYWVSLKIHGIE